MGLTAGLMQGNREMNQVNWVTPSKDDSDSQPLLVVARRESSNATPAFLDLPHFKRSPAHNKYSVNVFRINLHDKTVLFI